MNFKSRCLCNFLNSMINSLMTFWWHLRFHITCLLWTSNQHWPITCPHGGQGEGQVVQECSSCLHFKNFRVPVTQSWIYYHFECVTIQSCSQTNESSDEWFIQNVYVSYILTMMYFFNSIQLMLVHDWA